MAITDQSIYTSTWTEIYTVLAAANLITTNSATGATTAVKIGGSFNDESIKPQVVIHPVEKDEEAPKFGGNEGKKFINVIIDCYGTRGASVDQMNEQVEYALKYNQIIGIDMIGMISNGGFEPIAGNKYQLKSTTFTYDRE